MESIHLESHDFLINIVGFPRFFRGIPTKKQWESHDFGFKIMGFPRFYRGNPTKKSWDFHDYKKFNPGQIIKMECDPSKISRKSPKIDLRWFFTIFHQLKTDFFDFDTFAF